jgi:uncharacterized membrane protein
MLQRVLPALLLTVAASVAAETPTVLVCRGHEPEWNLRIDGPAATLAALDARGLTQTGFEGRLQETGARPSSFVYRGRSGPSWPDLVAMITPEACVDTMADEAEGGGRTDYTARVSLPDGATRQGCCTIGPAAIPPADAASSPGPPVAPPPVATAPVEPPPAAPSPVVPAPVQPPPVSAPPVTTHATPTASLAVGGEITVLALPDGRECRSTARGPTTNYRGQRVNFDCGSWGGDTVGLVGPLAVGTDGLLVAQKAVIEWRESGNLPREIETTSGRASVVTLGDGLTCRFSGMGATLAFEGLRANYTCGMMHGDTVLLLGDFEPVEGGFRITRARVANAGDGFALRSSETILVTAPR